MHPLRAPTSERPVAWREPGAVDLGRARHWCTTVTVERIGYLVPTADFGATVHSIFARACNFACGGSLLTLVLALASTPHLATNLRVATAALASLRRTHSSVIDREGSTVLDELGEACRALDAGTAAQQVERLIGWGEGLTRAGEDVLVGWRAALDALVDGHPGRADFLGKFSAAILAGACRATPLAAHCLRLAAQGHYNAEVIGLRNALLGESDASTLRAVLTDAFCIGATSGADMVTGMVAGIEAWLDVDPQRERGYADGEALLEGASG